jgi:hypothetical protein
MRTHPINFLVNYLLAQARVPPASTPMSSNHFYFLRLDDPTYPRSLIERFRVSQCSATRTKRRIPYGSISLAAGRLDTFLTQASTTRRLMRRPVPLLWLRALVPRLYLKHQVSGEKRVAEDLRGRDAKRIKTGSGGMKNDPLFVSFLSICMVAFSNLWTETHVRSTWST